MKLPTPAARTAICLCDSVSASIRSFRPSTCVKSRRPPKKARRVNSPGSAGRQNGIDDNAERIAAMTARPEWMWSSTTSSVVNDLGPWKERVTRWNSRHENSTHPWRTRLVHCQASLLSQRVVWQIDNTPFSTAAKMNAGERVSRDDSTLQERQVPRHGQRRRHLFLGESTGHI